eukprot:1159488-Pelagomonas_calceolata.AAC.8
MFVLSVCVQCLCILATAAYSSVPGPGRGCIGWQRQPAWGRCGKRDITCVCAATSGVVVEHDIRPGHTCCDLASICAALSGCAGRDRAGEYRRGRPRSSPSLILLGLFLGSYLVASRAFGGATCQWAVSKVQGVWEDRHEYV